MPDWIREAWRKLAGSKFSASEREEVSRELAGYLDDLCTESRAGDANEPSTAVRATRELNEDPRLGSHLYRARKENNMNDRTKQLWFPGITLMFVTAVTLALFQLAALRVFGAYAAGPHGHNVPDLMSWLMKYRSAALIVYLVWLYVVPFLAAAGAWWSRRAGSGRAMQVVSGLFPLVLFLAIFVGQCMVSREGTSLSFLAIDALPPAHLFFMFLPASGSLFLSWVVIPGGALLLGVLPFLLSSRTATMSPQRFDLPVSA